MANTETEEYLRAIREDLDAGVPPDQAGEKHCGPRLISEMSTWNEVCPECKVHRGHKAGCSLASVAAVPVEKPDYSLERYREFLRAKCRLPQELGVEIDPGQIHPWLKLHQKLAVAWAVRPMQFDLANREIEQWTNPGEIVFDPFAGLGTVPMIAVEKGRIGWGCELSHSYWLDSLVYCRMAEQKRLTPTLFDLIGEGDAEEVPIEVEAVAEDVA